MALSAILDLHQLIQDRPIEMKQMLEDQFGMGKGAKKEEWIAKRNPLNMVSSLKSSLPVLVIQGGEDPRIGLDEGKTMVAALKKGGHDVDYWEYSKGNHTLSNNPAIMNQIASWLESNSPCMSLSVSRKPNRTSSPVSVQP